MGVILRANPVRGESHIQRNANGEVATIPWAWAMVQAISKDFAAGGIKNH